MLRTLGITLTAATFCAAQTNFPPPPAPANNQPTNEKVLLGMALFFEEQMSSNGQVACATCHDFRSGGVDPRTAHSANPGPDALRGTADDQHGSPGLPMILPGANGVTVVPMPESGFAEQITPRRTPSVINSGYHTHLMGDGRHDSLESLIEDPPINRIEMGHVGRTWNDVTTKLAASTPLVFASDLPARLDNFIAGRSYPDLFAVTYGTTDITKERVVKAIAVYLRTLNSDQSRWDKHLHNQYTLTALEQQGLQLFNSTANGATACKTCHGDFSQLVLNEGPVAGAMTQTTSGPYGAPAPTRLVFHNIGVRPPNEDPGRMNVTGSTVDQGKFRTASLRNVALGAPYFHNGSAGSLRESIEFYNRGGDFHQNQAAMMNPRLYTEQEVDALVALLETLTDPRLETGTYPFDRPTLGTENGKIATSIGPAAYTRSGKLVTTAPFAPRLGESSFQLTLDGASVGAFTFIMWDTAAAAAPDPMNLQLALSPSFLIHPIGPAQWSVTAPGRATQRAMLPLPNNPQLSGAVLFAQWVSIETSRYAPLALSNALRIQLQ